MSARRKSLEILPEPVTRHVLFKNKARLLGFGKPYNWSLRPYVPETSEAVLATLDPTLYMPHIAQQFGLGQTLLAPSPKIANAVICTDPADLKTSIVLQSPLYRGKVELRRGMYADGLILPYRATYVVSPAGCPILIIRDTHTDMLGVAHAGLRSVIDEQRLLTNRSSRKFESVVMNLLVAMKIRDRRNAKRLEVVIAFPIEPEYFTYPLNDPKYGYINQKRMEDIVAKWGHDCISGYDDPALRAACRIDLGRIIVRQLMSFGVLEKNITTLKSPPREVWHDTREGPEGVRNLVYVQHL
jgi:hypothetical protein